MGKMIMTLAGAGIGAYFGSPQLGAQIGGTLGGIVFGDGSKGPQLNDNAVSASTYGNAIPRIYGSVRLSSNLIWTAGIKEHKKGGGLVGKGMGQGQKTTYTYTCSFAVAFCVGEIDEVLRIWGDTKLIFGASDMNKLRDALKNGADYGSLLGSYKLGKKKKKYTIRIYRGSEDQLPDAVIVANKGRDATPAYRGLCYAVFEDFPLTDFGNRIPQISAEVTRSKTAALPALEFRSLSGDIVADPLGFWDWDAGRKVTYDGLKFRVYSLRTMKQIGEFPSPPFKYPQKVAYTPGAGPIVVFDSLANSGKAYFVDGNTFQVFGNIGRPSNNLSDSAFDPCEATESNYQTTASIVGTGAMHALRVRQVNGYRSIWLNQNVFGTGSVWDFGGNFIGYLTRTGTPLTLGEFEGYTNFTIWNKVDGGVSADIYRINSNDFAATRQEPVPVTECGRGSKLVFSLLPNIHQETVNVAAPRGGSVTNLLYNEADNSLVCLCFNGAPYIALYSLTDRTFTRILECPGKEPIEGLGPSRLVGYKLGWARHSDNVVVTIDLTTGDYTEAKYIPASIIYPTDNVWDDTSQSLYITYNGLGFHQDRIFTQTLPTEVTAGAIVAEVLQETGQLTPAEYDVSEINDIPVMGYTVGREANARDIIQQLGGAFFFDAVESDYKLKFVKRGGAPKVTIYADQMGNVSDRDVQLRETLAQETEAPYRITINYSDQTRDYQTASQFAKRKSNPFPTMNSRREEKVELPIVLDADAAKQMADKGLKAAWVSRISNESVLPWKFLKYDPTDVVTIIMNDGSTRTSRITKMDIGEDMTIKVAGVNDSAVSYVSVLKGDAGVVPPQFAADPSPAELVVMNTPLLRDLDDTQGVGSKLYLSAVSPTGPFGKTYLQKAEPGTEFVDIGLIDSAPHAGYCLTALPATRAWAAMDRTTQLRVSLYDPMHTLESISYDELMAGQNLCVVGSEVIQFQNAEVQDDGTWIVSNILRARRGTDPMVATHRAGEAFTMVAEDGSVNVNLRPSIDMGHIERIRAIVPGEAVDDSVGLSYSIDANDLRPYTVQNLRVADLATGFKVAFERRSRITAGLKDSTATIPYREGDTATGNYAYRIWQVGGQTAKPWVVPEDGVLLRSGTVPLLGMNADGGVTINDNPAVTISDLAAPAPGDQYIVEIVHNGFVAGFPSRCFIRREADATWSVTALYA